MAQLTVDASNSCIPPESPLISLSPPLPSTTRGESLFLDGNPGRFNSHLPLLVYPVGRLVVVRDLTSDLTFPKTSASPTTTTTTNEAPIKAFVYRGHTSPVTIAKFSPSGAYIASADTKGKLRIWSYDNPLHLCKLDLSNALSGPIRDLSWDGDGKRICVIGEGNRSDGNSFCARVLQWDTGVTAGKGDLGKHPGNRACCGTFRKKRPYRIVTGGEDGGLIMNKGPPFTRVIVEENSDDGNGSHNGGHTKGKVRCVRYSPDGDRIVSVGSDRAVHFYDGTTMVLLKRMESVHKGGIYACAWNETGNRLLTCSADGTAKLIDTENYVVVKTWEVAESMAEEMTQWCGGKDDGKVPPGGMQLGCAFVKGDVPVTVGYNGMISILPRVDDDGTEINGEGTIRRLCGHQCPVSCFAIDHSEGIIYTGDSDGVICAWDLSTGNAVNYVQRGSDGEEDADKCLDTTLMNKVHSGAVTGLGLLLPSLPSQNKPLLLSVGWDDKIRTTSTSNRTSFASASLPAQPHRIAIGTTLVVVLTVEGLLLLSRHCDGATENEEEERCEELVPTPYGARSVCVSRDDTTVCVGGNDGTIHIYTVDRNDIENGRGGGLKEVRTLRTGTGGGSQRPVCSVAFSNDGTKLASGDVREIYVWNVVEDYIPLFGTSSSSRWCFHRQNIDCLCWSSDDRILASGGADDSIYLWCVEKTGTRLHYGYVHRGGVRGLEFLKEGDKMVLLSVGSDGCVNRWDVTEDVKKKFG